MASDEQQSTRKSAGDLFHSAIDYLNIFHWVFFATVWGFTTIYCVDFPSVGRSVGALDKSAYDETNGFIARNLII